MTARNGSKKHQILSNLKKIKRVSGNPRSYLKSNASNNDLYERNLRKQQVTEEDLIKKLEFDFGFQYPSKEAKDQFMNEARLDRVRSAEKRER